MPLIIFLFIIALGFIALGIFFFAPITNKFFSLIWAEEERPIIKRETQERLNELFVDGDVPEETAVVMAATEERMDDREVLEMFGAVNAKDLKGIVTNKKSKIIQVLDGIDTLTTKNMRRK